MLPLNNNQFGFVASLAAFIVACCPTLRGGRGTASTFMNILTTLAHIHKQRAESGFHTFLLQLLCDAQVRLRSHVTASQFPECSTDTRMRSAVDFRFQTAHQYAWK